MEVYFCRDGPASDTMADLSSVYRKHTHREHILELPDTYIGSIETHPQEVYVVEGESFVPHEAQINPGFYKLVDELLVNAHDQVIRLRQKKSDSLVKSIDVSFKDGVFTIRNDGEGIDVEEHPEHKVYIPELIFSQLLTSTNYDKSEKKMVGGKNGYGVKLVNIFAKEMTITIVDGKRQRKYVQTFRNNMSVIEKPKITPYKLKPFVEVAWTPDLSRFKWTEVPESVLKLIERRVYDLAMTVGKEVKVKWNEKAVASRDLKTYASMYLAENATVVVDAPQAHWNVVVSSSPTDKLFTVSFVNGIWTQSGKHVDGLVNQITSHLVEYLETKKKTKVRPGLVKDHLAVFVECLVENPSFSSQTKEVLTSAAPCKLSDEFLKKIATKLPIVERILEAQTAKDAKDNTKTDGKKQSRITGIPKLDDAMHAGTSRSSECTLILTEGDSAKAMALSGLSQEQRKLFGVYPLRGKLLNVKDTADARVEQTKEIAELKKIMGLASGKKYESTTSLRYGSIMIMTDQDYDGSHIRGLLINLFHELWHELIKIPGFLTYMATPIVKATRGKEVKSFYNTNEYEKWRQANTKGWKVKYYKGLGTSTRDEAKEYFQRLDKIQFTYSEASDTSIELAFNKSKANDRKDWLKTYNQDALIPAGSQLLYEDFVHKDLIHFSHYNLERSIPSVMDGLKTSQRKILYSAFKRNLTSEIRVAQFAGYVSEHSGYHHGEASLNDAIVGMAQDFVGANNIPWFVPQGQFGTRLQGGKDAASPRYIHTYLQPYVKSLVSPDDAGILKYRDDDGILVEPEWYAPVLPMLLVNGARGIGTGYSTFVPPCNPAVLEAALRAWLGGDKAALRNAPLRPWVNGYAGEIDADGTVHGKYKMEKADALISELPVGTWTCDFRETLEKWITDGTIKDFTDTSTDQIVNIRVKGVKEEIIKKALTDKLKTTNMHAFDAKGCIKKYDTLQDILIEYADVRLDMYEKRRLAMIAELETRLPYHNGICYFIMLQLDESINLRGLTEEECNVVLENASVGRFEESYDYLLRLPFRTLTKESIKKHKSMLAEINQKIQGLNESSAASLWIADLDDMKSKRV